MVHLSHVSSFPLEEDDHLSKEVRKLHLEAAADNDNFTTSVYGSKFAAQDLPRYEIPDGEMPREGEHKCSSTMLPRLLYYGMLQASL